MKIYLAGKIAGDPDYREKFQKAQERLERDGVTVLNPANNPEGLEKAEYMRLSFAMIDAADEVTFLPDAEESLGAQLERRYCEYIGKPFSALNHPEEPVRNDQLTMDELRELDAPVWLRCYQVDGYGYWCLCKNGIIITPEGNSYDVSEIPHWAFYRQKPEGTL